MKFSPHAKLLLLAASFAAPSVYGQILFSEAFDTDQTANWNVNLSHSDAFANVFFDYGSLGIPSAPNSVGGSTLGMRFLVNQSAGVFQGISASPKGLSLSGDYVLKVDMWMNYVGPLGPGGNGTTQFASVGIGSSGTSVQWASASSGTMFAMSLDGNSASDYRIYANNVNQSTASFYSANSQNNSATYYTTAFPSVSAPAAQLSLYPGQTGSTLAGSLGFAWREVEIRKEGATVSYSVDGTPIGSFTFANTSGFSTNFSLGMFDSNAGSSSEANDFLNAAIFDNVSITQLATPVPEPGTVALACLGLASVGVALRRKRS